MMIAAYAAYVGSGVEITVWVRRTLNRIGRLFLVEIVECEDELVGSIYHLLRVGFYLVNIRFVTLALKYGEKPTDAVEAIECLSTKFGFAVVVLGAMHFFNMMMLIKFRRSRLLRSLAPAA